MTKKGKLVTIPEPIKKLSDYMDFIETLDSSFCLSRGQSGDYPLLPSALRLDSDNKRKYSRRNISYFLEQFKIQSYQFIENPHDINNDIEWMLYAQHYGLPTKLLDFTSSHITSLLFAVEKAFISESTVNPVVYFLNPSLLNNKHLNSNDILNISKNNYNHDSHDEPIIIQGRLINKRVNAQKGLFVLFQDENKPLEEIVDDNVLKKITIDHDSTRDILSTLYSMGISFSHIYPELTSISKDIILKQDIANYIEG